MHSNSVCSLPFSAPAILNLLLLGLESSGPKTHLFNLAHANAQRHDLSFTAAEVAVLRLMAVWNVHVITRSTPNSPPNNMGQKSVCPSTKSWLRTWKGLRFRRRWPQSRTGLIFINMPAAEGHGGMVLKRICGAGELVKRKPSNSCSPVRMAVELACVCVC